MGLQLSISIFLGANVMMLCYGLCVSLPHIPLPLISLKFLREKIVYRTLLRFCPLAIYI